MDNIKNASNTRSEKKPISKILNIDEDLIYFETSNLEPSSVQTDVDFNPNTVYQA